MAKKREPPADHPVGRERQQLYQDLFREMVSGFALHEVVLDDAGRPVDYRFLDVNPAFEKLTGLHREDLIGRTVLEVLPETESYWIHSFGEVALTGVPAHFENYSRELDRTFEVTAFCPREGQFAVTFNDVTARRRAEEALTESEQRYRSLFENNHAAMLLIDPDTASIVDANPAACAYYGYPRQTLQGMPITDINIQSEAEVRREMSRAREERRTHFLFEHRLASGEVRHVEVFSGPITVSGSPVLYSIVHDVTERWEMERALRESERRLRELLRNVRLFAVGLDTEGRVTFCNDFLLKTTGWERAEVVGQNWFDRLVPSGEGIREVFLENILQGTVPLYHESEILTRANGRLLVAWNNTVLRNSDGEVTGTASIGEDITKRRATEEEQRRARVAAEAANRAKSEFLANMSHEIRTPMNGVLGLLHLILDTHLTPEQRLYLQTAKTSADSLLRILNDILDFSKVEAGELELEEVPFEPVAIVEDVLRFMTFRAHEKGLELCSTAEEGARVQARGDPGRIRQVLTNLVDNAIKFSEAGTIAVRIERLDSGEEEQPRGLRFTVCDTGIGIPEEARSELFASFHQADSSITRRFGGTGLGLAIARQIVEQMGGRIDCRSAPGRGAEFWFEVPLSILPSAEVSLPPMDRPPRVLVVDDSPIAGAALREALEGLGASASLTTTGHEAMALVGECRARGEDFDLVLVDSRMPGMDGFETAGRIRGAFGGERPRLALLVTVDQGVEDLARCEGLGVTACLVKPPTTREVRNLLVPVPGASEGHPPLGLAARSPPEGATRPRAPANGSVLVVEDQEINRLLAEALIRREGWQVQSVRDGREAIEAVKSGDFDVVLMDLQMPEMDGFHATRAIRGLGGRRGEVPIVGLTAHAVEGYREKCLEAGMDEYLVKPLDPARLVEVLARFRPEQDDVRGEAAPPVDRDRFGQLAQAGDGLVRRLAARFREDAPMHVARLESAIEDADAEEIQFVAHRLRGSAVLFGAMEVSECATRLEEMGRSGRLDGAEEELGRLRRETDRLLDYLKSV